MALFSIYQHISTKKEYIDKRIKLEHSYVIFFAYNSKNTIDAQEESEENNNLTINQEWADFFDEISANKNFTKYLDIVMVK